MAPTAGLSARIDLDLDALFYELEDLIELAEIWDEEPDHMQYAEMLTWDSCMSTLSLDRDPAYHSGQMTLEQQARYRDLLRRLKEVLPILQNLGFSRPSVSLDIAA